MSGVPFVTMRRAGFYIGIRIPATSSLISWGHTSRCLSAHCRWRNMRQASSKLESGSPVI